VTYVFGPVPSRRLGLSLGVDLIPPKTCSYDCLYCQVGRTTCVTVEPKAFVSLEQVLKELKESFTRRKPDFVTFSGSGEPTLHSGIGEAISFVKKESDLKVAVLTNGSLLWRQEVRERLLEADVIMPTLSTVDEETFRKIHRPHPDLRVSKVIQGLKRLREIYNGELHVEVMLLAGLNDSDKELTGLKDALIDIAPDRIQLNTVVRPPADAGAISLDRVKMEEVKNFFGKKAEVVAFIPPVHRDQSYDSLSAALVEMAKRRPVRTLDAAHALGIAVDEVERLVKGLMLKGYLRSQAHLDETYYVSDRS
jgi:wyosine [tRNA(Phe)-imidazoG37] synthetase (radical SAM superfamily)